MAKVVALTGTFIAALLLLAREGAAAPEEPLIVAPPPPPSPPTMPTTGDPQVEDEKIPRPLLALAAGAFTSTASFATGVVIISRYSDRTIRNAAMLGAFSGMTLAPVLAHMIVGETKRGILFGLIPLATELGMGGLMLYRPNLITIAPVGVQYTYIALIAAAIFGSAIGTLDAVRVEERKPQRPRPVVVRAWPMFGNGMAGAMIGGSL